MKLLILSTEFPPGPGGIGTLTYQIARYLAEHRWQVVVSTPQCNANLLEIEKFNASQPFDILRLKRIEPPILEGAYRLIKAIQIVRYIHPDIVLASGKQAVWLGAVISLIARIPLMAIGYGTEFLSVKTRRLTRWAFGRAQCIVAISNYTCKLISAMGIDTSKVRIIPPEAEANLFRPGLATDQLRNRLKLHNSKIILTVGRVCERKAQDVVIKALPRVLQDCPNVKYLIVGLPKRREELEQLAKNLGVEDHILFLGKVPREELPYFYNLADVFVLVSRRMVGGVEGYGIVVVEAALCGTPAIVSRNCGLEEAVVENETALVVNPDDPEATAEAITRLLLDDTLRSQMGQAAFRYATENVTRGKRLQEYDAILRSLVAGGKACTC